MKKVVILVILSLFTSCSSVRNDVDSEVIEGNKTATTPEIPMDSIEGAYLLIDKKKYDFGKIDREKTPHIPIEFELKNIGKSPLIIVKSDVSCGCLSVDYPKEPILPGKNSKLILNVNTTNQEGTFNKTVFIKSNADNDVVLIRVLGDIYL